MAFYQNVTNGNPRKILLLHTNIDPLSEKKKVIYVFWLWGSCVRTSLFISINDDACLMTKGMWYDVHNAIVAMDTMSLLRCLIWNSFFRYYTLPSSSSSQTAVQSVSQPFSSSSASYFMTICHTTRAFYRVESYVNLRIPMLFESLIKWLYINQMCLTLRTAQWGLAA